MSEIEDKNQAPAETEADEVEVVAHGEEEEELNAGCIINGKSL